MNINGAKKELLAFLRDHSLRRGEDDSFQPYIYLWPTLDRRVGVRVAELGWATDRAGAAYMQSDMPHGLLVCAAAERLLLDLCIEEPNEIENSKWALQEALWPAETKTDK